MLWYKELFEEKRARLAKPKRVFAWWPVKCVYRTKCRIISGYDYTYHCHAWLQFVYRTEDYYSWGVSNKRYFLTNPQLYETDESSTEIHPGYASPAKQKRHRDRVESLNIKKAFGINDE